MNQPLSSRQDIWTDWNFENAGKNHANYPKSTARIREIFYSAKLPIKYPTHPSNLSKSSNERTNQPTKQPTNQPTKQASNQPSKQATKQASKQPTLHTCCLRFCESIAWRFETNICHWRTRNVNEDARHRYLWQHFGNTWHFLHTVDGSEILLTSWGW